MASSETPLTVNAVHENGWAIVDVDGDLDMATAPALSDAVESLRTDSKQIAIELDGIEFIDSSGLRALLTARKELNSNLVLVNPSAVVTDLLDMTRLDDAFAIVDDRASLPSV